MLVRVCPNRMTAAMKLMISSTSSLREHRLEIAEVCQRCGCIALSQDLKSSEPTKPIDFSLGLVEEGDAIIVLIGARYGTVPPGESRSFSQIEYERAVELRKPAFLFFLDASSPEWSLREFANPDEARKQRTFLAAVQIDLRVTRLSMPPICERRLCSRFTRLS